MNNTGAWKNFLKAPVCITIDQLNPKDTGIPHCDLPLPGCHVHQWRPTSVERGGDRRPAFAEKRPESYHSWQHCLCHGWIWWWCSLVHLVLELCHWVLGSRRISLRGKISSRSYCCPVGTALIGVLSNFLCANKTPPKVKCILPQQKCLWFSIQQKKVNWKQKYPFWPWFWFTACNLFDNSHTISMPKLKTTTPQLGQCPKETIFFSGIMSLRSSWCTFLVDWAPWKLHAVDGRKKVPEIAFIFLHSSLTAQNWVVNSDLTAPLSHLDCHDIHNPRPPSSSYFKICNITKVRFTMRTQGGVSLKFRALWENK